MKVERLALPDVLLIATVRHEDARGFFAETYNARSFEAASLPNRFVQDNVSRSARFGTVRALHFQRPPMSQAKLVRVVRGRILDVAVDLRLGSPTFGRHVAVELTAARGEQLFVPHGFAHGFCTLEPDTEVFYKVDQFYSAEHDWGVRWNDPALDIAWPVSDADAVLSAKDQRLPLLDELPAIFGVGDGTTP